MIYILGGRVIASVMSNVSRPPVNFKFFIKCWSRHLHWRAAQVYGREKHSPTQPTEVFIKVCLPFHPRAMLGCHAMV